VTTTTTTTTVFRLNHKICEENRKLHEVSGSELNLFLKNKNLCSHKGFKPTRTCHICDNFSQYMSTRIIRENANMIVTPSPEDSANREARMMVGSLEKKNAELCVRAEEKEEEINNSNKRKRCVYDNSR